MLQKSFAGLCHVLLDIINASLVTGKVPAGWKHAIVTPIPKGGDLGKVSNWRPISILPAITKVVEKLVHRQISEYFNRNHLFSKSQHGYRRHHSTETALTVITDRVYRAMDQGEISILVCLDCSKCFDVIDHSKLLSKLETYGVDTHWLADYFSGHTQQVKIAKDGVQSCQRHCRTVLEFIREVALVVLCFRSSPTNWTYIQETQQSFNTQTIRRFWFVAKRTDFMSYFIRWRQPSKSF